MHIALSGSHRLWALGLQRMTASTEGVSMVCLTFKEWRQDPFQPKCDVIKNSHHTFISVGFVLKKSTEMRREI
jgi:hypothetical protein